jgi:predicted transcriptional regulator
VEDLLKNILKDSLASDILKFFFENQSSIDTARGISAWIHRTREEVIPVLEQLASAGVLEKDSTGSTNGYCYTRKKEIMDIVTRLMERDEKDI